MIPYAHGPCPDCGADDFAMPETRHHVNCRMQPIMAELFALRRTLVLAGLDNGSPLTITITAEENDECRWVGHVEWKFSNEAGFQDLAMDSDGGHRDWHSAINEATRLARDIQFLRMGTS